MSKTTDPLERANVAWHEAAGAAASLARQDPIAGIRMLGSMRNEMDLHLGSAVERARRAGRTWDEIGAALRMSRQGAQKAYRHVDRNILCDAAVRLRESTPCTGTPAAVWVYDSERVPAEPGVTPGGVAACVEHGARLYAGLRNARVYPQAGHGPDALKVYYRADEIRNEQRGGQV